MSADNSSHKFMSKRRKIIGLERSTSDKTLFLCECTLCGLTHLFVSC